MLYIISCRLLITWSHLLIIYLQPDMLIVYSMWTIFQNYGEITSTIQNAKK
jgi:hypothetical protein